MKLIKKVGIGSGVVVAVFFGLVVLSNIGSYVEEENVKTSASNTSASELEIESQIIPIESVVELLPTRNELGTEWIKRNFETVNGGSQGFVEGIKQLYLKDISIAGTDQLIITIYRFDSPQNARNFYDDNVSKLIEQGGFSEWKQFEISAEKCYGTEGTSALLDDVLTIRCIKDQFYIHMKILGLDYDLRDEIIRLERTIVEKI